MTRQGMLSRNRALAMILFLALARVGWGAQPARKQNKPSKNDQKEPVTQTLAVLPDPPMAVAAETERLVFHISALSAKGLLSQQVRDGLKSLERENRGAQIVKLRAFVAGSGDLRRVEQIVSEVFTGKKQPLPVLTTVQVGALPLEGAQVVLESAAMEKRPAGPPGLVFLSARPVEALVATGKAAGDVMRVTCFLTSLEGLEQVRSRVAEAFPGAAADFVQLTRLGGTGAGEAAANCEGVARGSVTTAVEGTVAVGSKVVFSGMQMAFRDQAVDVRLAFDRLKKAIEPLGGRMEGAFVGVYPVTKSAGEAVNSARGAAGAPTMLFEGLPSLDAAVGIEVAAPAD